MPSQVDRKARASSRLLDDTRLVSFDLFDTLIELDSTCFPYVSWEGTKHPSTVPLLYDAMRSMRSDLTIEDFMTAFLSVNLEIHRYRDESWLEVSAQTSFERLVRRLLPSTAEEESQRAECLRNVQGQATVQAARPVHGAVGLVEHMKRRELRTALISNCDNASMAESILQAFGLGDVLDEVIVSETLGVRKPHPRMFERALVTVSVPPEAALHIGDEAEADVWGAAQLGLRTVWVNRRQAVFPKAGNWPTLTVKNLSDLWSYL